MRAKKLYSAIRRRGSRIVADEHMYHVRDLLSKLEVSEYAYKILEYYDSSKTLEKAYNEIADNVQNSFQDRNLLGWIRSLKYGDPREAKVYKMAMFPEEYGLDPDFSIREPDVKKRYGELTEVTRVQLRKWLRGLVYLSLTKFDEDSIWESDQSTVLYFIYNYILKTRDERFMITKTQRDDIESLADNEARRMSFKKIQGAVDVILKEGYDNGDLLDYYWENDPNNDENRQKYTASLKTLRPKTTKRFAYNLFSRIQSAKLISAETVFDTRELIPESIIKVPHLFKMAGSIYRNASITEALLDIGYNREIRNMKPVIAGIIYSYLIQHDVYNIEEKFKYQIDKSIDTMVKSYKFNEGEIRINEILKIADNYVRRTLAASLR